MSKISLKHSGGNVVSLNSPSSAPTSADVAFKLPNADGTSGQVLKTDGSGNLSFGADTGGKILQVVQTYKKDSFSTASSTPVEITGLNATITKTSASNKLLIIVDVAYGKNGRSTARFQLFEDSSEITAANSTQGTADNFFMYDYTHLAGTTEETYSIRNLSKTFLYDGANDTSSHTIKVYGCAESSTTLYLGRTSHNDPSIGTASGITIMEVAA
tara:strand:+ start:487 stop:1131 length:645 start_codon:yes stop_codon:yes gene_type:complete